MADSAMIVPVKVTPDMVGQTIGLSVQLEFKAGNSKQTENQKLWQSATENAGGIYAIARSVEEFHLLMGRLQN